MPEGINVPNNLFEQIVPALPPAYEDYTLPHEVIAVLLLLSTGPQKAFPESVPAHRPAYCSESPHPAHEANIIEKYSTPPSSSTMVQGSENTLASAMGGLALTDSLDFYPHRRTCTMESRRIVFGSSKNSLSRNKQYRIEQPNEGTLDAQKSIVREHHCWVVGCAATQPYISLLLYVSHMRRAGATSSDNNTAATCSHTTTSGTAAIVAVRSDRGWPKPHTLQHASITAWLLIAISERSSMMNLNGLSGRNTSECLFVQQLGQSRTSFVWNTWSIIMTCCLRSLLRRIRVSKPDCDLEP
jgi:hypothetical protein